MDLLYKVVPHFHETTGINILLKTTGIKIIGIEIQIEVEPSTEVKKFEDEELDSNDGQVQAGRCAIEVEELDIQPPHVNNMQISDNQTILSYQGPGT